MQAITGESIRGTESFDSYKSRLESAVDAARKYLGQGDYLLNSGHEGYAIIRKHVDNLWIAVKNNDGSSILASKIAMSIVASVVCYMVHVVKGNNVHWDSQPTLTRDERVDVALRDMQAELLKARTKFPPFNSPAEGFAVLLEEFDELWDEIKTNKDRTEDAYAEAKQVGAMALSYVLDCVHAQPRVVPNAGQVEAEES